MSSDPATSHTETEILVHDGTRVRPASDAVLPVLDHGFLFGDSVYEVVRTARHRPFQLRGHLDRMRASAAMIYFELPWSDALIEERIQEVGRALGPTEAGVAEGYFRIIATRGPGPISLSPEDCDQPGLYVVGRELIRYPAERYSDGCDLAIVPRLRNDPRAIDPAAKTGNYLNNMLGLVEARRAGAHDALFLNAEGQITESTTSNAWVVRGGRVATPPLAAGLLAGITRSWMFSALPAAGISVEEAGLTPADLEGADEVFLSGTVKGIMPVCKIDGRPVGDGRPGEVTLRATALYAAALQEA